MVAAFVLQFVSSLFGLLALVMIGAVLSTERIAELRSPGGPLIDSRMRIVQGQVTLVAGAATEALTTAVLPVGVPVYCSRRVNGGVLGNLSAVNDGAGNLVIGSSNAGDTSSVAWFFFAFS